MKQWKWLSHDAINNGQKGSLESESLNALKKIARQWEDSVIIEQWNEKYSFICFRMVNGRLTRV